MTKEAHKIHIHHIIAFKSMSIPYVPITAQTISKKLRIKELLTQIAPEMTEETDIHKVYEYLKAKS